MASEDMLIKCEMSYSARTDTGGAQEGVAAPEPEKQTAASDLLDASEGLLEAATDVLWKLREAEYYVSARRLERAIYRYRATKGRV